MMLRCGLLGRKLSHSYSPQIHSALGDYSYVLFEKEPDELESFIKGSEWDCLNVTVPYKKNAAALCDELSDTARRTGSVNTLVHRNGKIYGDNTDVYGFTALLKKAGVSAKGKKALILGSGGASAAALDALTTLGAVPIIISRSGENNYGNISIHSDASLIVNATPVGMYPENGVSPVDLSIFQNCEAVFDMIYNPARTAFLLDAEKLGIRGENGLYMLTAQAKRSSELFTGTTLDDSLIDSITESLKKQMRNIILIGMPGCGKSTVAKLLSEKTGREILDSDEYIFTVTGRTAGELVAQSENDFRAAETRALSELCKLSGKIIATGGGCVTREENYALLHQNGVIVLLERDIDLLECEGRPLSMRDGVRQLYKVREPLYRRFADITINNNGAPEETVRRIMENVL